MKNTITKIIMLALIGLSNISYGQTPNWVWTQSAGSTGNESSYSTITDAFGNVYVTGYYTSPTITLGTTTLTNTSAGSEDIFIVKYDASGNVLWAKGEGGSSYDWGISIAVDGSGNSFITGSFGSPSITFGATTLTKTGSYLDLFIVKYDPNGNVLWAKKQDGGGTTTDYPTSIAANDSGNVIITGSFSQGSITFGTTTLTNGSNFAPCTFIVKYDGNGNVLWAKSPTGNSSGSGVTTDASGNVYVTGSFITPTISFGTITLSNADIINISNDIFIVKYNANGTALWARKQTAGGTSNDYANSVAVDTSGNVIITGNFLSPSITFGSNVLTNAGSSTGDIFIVKYGPTGTVLWARQQDAGGSLGDDAGSVAADANGNVLVSGSFDSPTLSFGIITLTNAGSSGSDIFIVKYDPNGNLLWAKQQDSGGTGGDGVSSVAADNNGNVYVAGGFNSPSITFGATTLTNAGGNDMFIAKLATTTGIENNILNNEVSVYPNPTTGLLFLSSSYNVTLTDLTGKIITQEQNTNAIDISNQPSGMYFLLLADNKGQIVKRSKVMKE
ncbi:MAG: SBBP repeat-containing protein [Bacteroidetes bacterium]|nr:SBBP repeat-containing protein [Bacteroidota bacterium]